MRRLVFLFLLLLTFLFAGKGNAQYTWQNPLDLGFIDLGNKYALLYNIGGLALSSFFDKNKHLDRGWETAFYAEYLQEYNPYESTTDVFAGKARLGKQLHRWVQAGVELQLLRLKNAELNTSGIGGAVYFNWYFVNKTHFRFYFDNGFGVIGTARNFPNGGTAFNFSNFYGLSASFKIRPEMLLNVGLRNMHLSNAYLFGEDRNPAFDGLGIHVGFEFMASQ